MRRQLFIAGLAAICFVSTNASAQSVAVVEQPPQPQPAQPLSSPQGSPQQQPSTVRPPAAPQPVRPVPPSPADPRMLAASTQPLDMSSQPAPLLRAEPRMIGDFPGYFGSGFITVHSFLSAGPFPNGVIIPGNPNGDPPTPPIVIVPRGGSVPNFAQIDETYRFAALALGRGAFKIAENEAVQPQDRVYVTYNYFHQIPNQLLAADGFLTVLPNPLIRVAPGPYVLRDTLGATLIPNNIAGQPTTLTNPIASATNLHRETIGFEKTLFDGNASFGMRLPVFQSDQAASTQFDAGRLQSFTVFPNTGNTTGVNDTLGPSRVGDLTMVFKYAFINDPECGRTLSGGLVVTAPTGGGILLADGSKLYSTLLQPWLGAYRSWDRLFVHGFTSIAVPTDNRDLTLYFSDIGVGYFAYRNPDAWLSSITPTFECHVNIPFEKTRDSGISSSDVIVLTGGLHFGLGCHTSLTFAAATPITGPRPDQFEATVQLNWGF
jgi:hypothetical protein